MKFGNLLAPLAAAVLATAPSIAAAEPQRVSKPTAQESALGETAPWPLVAVGVAALAALVFLLVDDDDDAVSA